LPCQPPQTLVPAEETLAQSRAAEAALSREERAEIQEALKAEGFYTGRHRRLLRSRHPPRDRRLAGVARL
jgi:hypothetical protein